MKKKILIFSLTDLNMDSRVRRQIEALENDFEIIVSAINPDKSERTFIPVKSQKFYKLNFRLLIRVLFYPLAWMAGKIGWGRFRNSFFFLLRYWSVEKVDLFNRLHKLDFDLIIANDYDTWPLAAKLKKRKNIPVVFDAHEYYPKQFEYNSLWIRDFQPYVFFICKKFIGQCDLFLTVSEGISEEYRKSFGVKPLLISNAVGFFKELKPSPIKKKNIRIVHHGAAVKGRRIESMMEVAEKTGDGFAFDFYLVPLQKKYYEKLVETGKKINNVNVYPALPYNKLITTLNQYDLGIFLLHPNSFNHHYVLPNKFFEYIQARLAIAIGPSPEMKRIVEKYDLGIVSENFSPDSMANALKKLTVEKLAFYKNNTHTAASILCAEKNQVLLKKEIVKLIAPDA